MNPTLRLNDVAKYIGERCTTRWYHCGDNARAGDTQTALRLIASARDAMETPLICGTSEHRGEAARLLRHFSNAATPTHLHETAARQTLKHYGLGH